MKKILIILGPTATGKTDLGIYLSQKYNGELIACDSRQVYKDLDLGTGKFPGTEMSYKKFDGYWEIEGVKVWMYDLVEVKEQYDVAKYLKDASNVVEDVINRGKLPMIVGGTGLYLNALVNGMIKTNASIDWELREQLEKKSLSEIQGIVRDLSAGYFNQLNNSERNNKRRLIRKVEILKSGNSTKSLFEGLNKQYEILTIGLFTSRDKLNKRIDQRVIKRVDLGLIEEGKNLIKEGVSVYRMRALGLEYGVLADYFDKQIFSIEEFITKLQYQIHQYAKRQMTYFNKYFEINWFDVEENNYLQSVEKLFREWYYNQNAKKD